MNLRKLLVFGTVITTLLSTGILYAQEEITIKGSTTVLPIAQFTAEEYMDAYENVDISVQGGGSGVGIAALIDGTTDIADASRPMKEKEITKAQSRGIEPKEHVVAKDGIAVITNPALPLEKIELATIKDIYTGKISNWKELGGPDQKIIVISRDSASGTYEAFNELALDKAKVRPDALLQASNQAVMNVVSRTPGAIGYIGLGFLSNNVKAFSINGVEPTEENVGNGQYPLARPLYMYTNGDPKGVVKEYIDYVLSEEGQQLVEEAGYISINQ